MARPLVLASTSPRRVQLLREAGHAFAVVSPEVEEAHDPSLGCEALTMENARRKAVAGSRLAPEALVIGADTLVYIDQFPLSKPKDMEEARVMLRRLSGRTHEVCTGVALAWNGGNDAETFAVITHVTFRHLDEPVIRAYHALVHVLDKAGGYAAQEHGDVIIERMEGSLSNVIGLPMEVLEEHLTRWQQAG